MKTVNVGMHALLVSANPIPSGRGVESVLEHSWSWPPWLTVLIVVLAALLIVFIYRRETKSGAGRMRYVLITLRVFLILMVVFMLHGFIRRLRTTDLPDILLLVDDSASMSIVDYFESEQGGSIAKPLTASGSHEFTRMNRLKAFWFQDDGEFITYLDANYNLKLTLLSALKEVEFENVDVLVTAVRQAKPDHPTSRLGDRVRTLLEQQRGRPTAALIVMTDGVTTEGEAIPDAARYARRKGIPLYLVGVGSERPARDVGLSDLLADDVAYLDDLVTFEFSVKSTGYAGREIEIRLREESETVALATRKLPIAKDTQLVRTAMRFRPKKTGDLAYRVEIDALEGEANIENNSLIHRLSVRDEKIKVLLVQSYPSYEFRFLKNLLGRGRVGGSGESVGPIELTTVLQEADLEYAQIDEFASRVFPVGRDELFEYDVLIFGDVDPTLLSRSAMSDIQTFVTEFGRSVIFFSGPRHTPKDYVGTPLETLFPVDIGSALLPAEGEAITEGFTLRPTRLGLAAPQMQLEDTEAGNERRWADLPPLYWCLEAQGTKPGVRVLATHSKRDNVYGNPLPIITLQYVGAGKVVFHASDETWRWRVGEGDLYFGRYWLQAIRFLSRSRLAQNRSAELSASRKRFRLREPVQLRVRFFDDRIAPIEDDGVSVVLQRMGSRDRRIRLSRSSLDRGIFETSVLDLRDGNYHAWLATPTLTGPPPAFDFMVDAQDNEMTRLEADFTELRDAAKESNGRFYKIETAGRLRDDLPEGRRVPVDTLPAVPLWNSWPVALLFLTLLTSEWLLRNRAGLM